VQFPESAFHRANVRAFAWSIQTLLSSFSPPASLAIPVGNIVKKQVKRIYRMSLHHFSAAELGNLAVASPASWRGPAAGPIRGSLSALARLASFESRNLPL
jgi:hypothetical protein